MVQYGLINCMLPRQPFLNPRKTGLKSGCHGNIITTQLYLHNNSIIVYAYQKFMERILVRDLWAGNRL